METQRFIIQTQTGGITIEDVYGWLDSLGKGHKAIVDEIDEEIHDEIKAHKEVIKYLVKEIWNEVSDGDMPDINTIKAKLIKIGIDPEELMVY